MAQKQRKLSTRELKMEARVRFEQFIAKELDNKDDVATSRLAQAFYHKEEALLRKIAVATLLNILVKWADDILSQSISRQTARNGDRQLILPLGLEGIEVPGAISFISGANQLKFVATHKAVGFHMDSHAYLLRKHDDEVHTARLEFDKLHAAVKPLMDTDPKMTLPQALKKLADGDRGAA